MKERSVFMQPSVTMKSETIEEAIKSALAILQASMDEVEIAILQNPSKTLFGLRKQLAEVKVTKISRTPDVSIIEEMSMDPAVATDSHKDFLNFEKLIDSIQLDEKDTPTFTTPKSDTESGTRNSIDEQTTGVWIESGKVIVNASPTKYPILSAEKNVEVLVNGRKVNSKQIVSEQDQIEVRLKDEVIPTQFSIELHERDMKALLRIIPGKKITRTLADTTPEISLCIEAHEEMVPFNELTTAQIMYYIKDMNITEGIDYPAITSAVESLDKIEMVIAKGIAPLEGQNGEITILYNNEIFNSVKEQKKVDFREMNQIVDVEEGQILAKILPPVQGRPGKDVFGNPIHPKPVHSVDVRASKNVFIKNDEIIARASGRPTIERRGRLVKVDIAKELVHHGDLTIDTGNIRFQGDVRVKGDVTDSMVVEASGKITIEGTLTKANIQSSQSAHIANNVFSSRISVGKANILIAELILLLKGILTNLDQMHIALQQLLFVNKQTEETISPEHLNHLIRLLTEKKYTSNHELIHLFYQKIMKNHMLLDNDWMDVGNRLHQQFIVLTSGNNTSSFTKLIEEVRNVYELYCIPPDPKSNLAIPYAINSTLYCSGNIYVSGQGTYHCQIQAGNDVRISGVCRGGEIVAGNNVWLEETGSEVGVKTIIRVPINGVINMQHVHPGTLIQIGNRIHTFAVEEFNINAKIGEDGMISIR